MLDDQHEHRDAPGTKVYFLVAQGAHVHREAERVVRVTHREGAARGLFAETRERPGEQTLKGIVVGARARGQPSALVDERIALSKDASRPVIRRDDPPAPIQLNDAGSGLVQKLGEGRAKPPASARAHRTRTY